MKSSSSTSEHDRLVLDRASVLYEAILGRANDDGARIATYRDIRIDARAGAGEVSTTIAT